MSFGEKLTSIMQRPGEDPVAKDDVPWWLKYAGRGLGTVGSGIAIFLGVWNCASILLGNISCLLGGIWQMLAGFAVFAIEAPCCCLFIDFVQNLSDWVDKRPYWNRAAFYCAIAIPPLLFCFGMGTLFGCGLIFGTGVLYGMMAVGRKAPFHDMRTAAATVATPQTSASTSTKSNLVQNAQPMSFSAPPVDSIV
ncbi:calcium channel flower isoform X1 [Belonocnema kinseyi]|uniref:calcium channel flower isoform X1 n=1 Tax=Belonocnema kinseyi TaxID=2817044 RepID=UPI00143DAEFD|nr:calcium channel flower isoform X1 [Belonocnema kinseyi]